ncbi:hypothetical protein PHMEG_00020330 [Phytophthora megakarya]|uniref:Uncharacterized protein n=1 Tax=Phytophthora megakarya TaxID=4795 RepID=A0A225VPN5_9STRA|nr:hypothetical protein PHMEG_00020330 [Phytophthora megakarya]
MNRARAAERKELQTLREQIPHLQKRLKMMQQEMEKIDMGALASERQGTIELWRKMAVCQRHSRTNAEQENHKLRELVREHNELTNLNLQLFLQTIQGHVETIERLPYPWPCRRQCAVPLESSDNWLFKDMAGTIDFVHRQVLRVFSIKPKNAHPRLFADKILPYSVELTGDAAWQFFAHSFRRPTTRFFYHAQTTQLSKSFDRTLLHDCLASNSQPIQI